jgi:hypothetical protein
MDEKKKPGWRQADLFSPEKKYFLIKEDII